MVVSSEPSRVDAQREVKDSEYLLLSLKISELSISYSIPCRWLVTWGWQGFSPSAFPTTPHLPRRYQAPKRYYQRQ